MAVDEDKMETLQSGWSRNLTEPQSEECAYVDPNNFYDERRICQEISGEYYKLSDPKAFRSQQRNGPFNHFKAKLW